MEKICVNVSNAFVVSVGRVDGAAADCLRALVRSLAAAMMISVVDDVGMVIP